MVLREYLIIFRSLEPTIDIIFVKKKTIDILHYAFHFDINRPSSSRNLKEAFLQLNIHTFYQKIHTFFKSSFLLPSNST